MQRCRRTLTLSAIFSALTFSVASAQTAMPSRVLKTPATELLTFVTPDALALPRASAVPVIDGAPEALWNSAPEQTMAVFASDGSTTPVDNNRDLSAKFRILWDDDNLYVFAAITDEDVATPQNVNPWERDSFELYLDGNNSKNSVAQGYDGDDTQIRFVFNAAPASSNTGYDVGVFEYAYAATDSGWNVEIKLPFSAMPFAAQPDQEIGLDLQVNDNDQGQRQHILKWWSASDDSWRDPSLFGTAQFLTSGLIADFSATPTAGSPPLSVAFTDQTSGEVSSRVWDFGDGESSTDTNPVHIYETSGGYSVSLTVTGPEGTATREKPDYIHVSSAPPLPWQAELDDNPVFDDTVIPEISIVIDPDSLALMFHPDSLQSRHEYPATFVFNNGAFIDTVENVGFRLRGNTSRFSAKKSFKVSFNSFQRGGKYFGLEKLNLNGEHNDPSIIRSKLCWDLFKKMRVPSSRANHVKVFVNGEYRGLYINVEHIDENFVRARFGGNDGNLYKCLWPADLTYVGSSPDLYKFEVGDRRTYDLKTNREADDYSDLAEFIRVLNQTPDNEFADAIQQVFNVNGYLRVLAVDVAAGSWDDYWFLKNNYYLYHNPATGKFEFIPYDYDNTFGIDWVDSDWVSRPVYEWGNQGEPRPLAERLLAVPEFRDRYSFYLGEILQQFVADRLVARVDALHDMITPAAEADSYRSLDYGYTIDDFHRSYTEATGGHVEYGVKPYISLRRATAFIQLELNNIAPIISEVRFAPEFPQVGESIVVNAFIDDEDAAPAVQVFSALNGVSRDVVALFDDGTHDDGPAGDRVFGGTLPAAASAGTLTFYISAEDGGGEVTTAPRDAPVHTFAIKLVSSVPALFINEFMASNDSTIADEAGEYDDWVELYNGDSTAIWLGDKFLTDNLGNLDKWQLPDTTLQAGEFLLVWCDSDPEQGPLHTSFKLSAGSEQIGVVASVTGGFVPIDSLAYGPQQTDVSFGRSEDGGAVWQTFVAPTPGLSNEQLPTAVPVISSAPQTFSLMQNYPNPFNPATTIRYSLDRDGEASLQVYNLLGQVVYTVVEDAFQKRGSHSVVVDLSRMSTGIYFYRLESEGRLITRKLTLMK